MKKNYKILIGILCISILSSTFNMFVFAADKDASSMSLTVTKSIKMSDGVVYTTRPYTITAVYDNGSAEAIDKFKKKSWFRVDLIDADVSLMDIYNENKKRENIIQTDMRYYANTWRTNFEIDVTINGTYIFCGWSENTSGMPDFIERMDITGIELERPIAWLEGYMSGDFTGDVIANVVVKNIECGKGAKIKRYALVKDYALPPGSWPESLPPEYCNEYFDERIAKLYNWFINGGLYLGDNTYTNEGSEILPEKDMYPIRDVGSYILFIEDSNGRYNHINFTIEPTVVSAKPIEITAKIISNENDSATVGVNVESEYAIARLDYAVLGEHNITKSENGTDEYFLEKEKYEIKGDTIEISETTVICAMDIYGNTCYKRVEISNEPITSPIPSIEPTITPTIEPTATPTLEPTLTPTIEQTLEPTSTVTPEPTINPEYELLRLVNSNGDEVSRLNVGDEVHAEAVYNSISSKNVSVYMALYDSNGVLKDVKFSKQNIRGNETVILTTDSITVPDNTDSSYIKLFLWDENLTPLHSILKIN